MNRIYLDYAASTPVDPRVLEAMKPYFSEKFGNPGSLHSFGQEAIAAVDHSREIIAKSIGADFREIIFTDSATEANNLATRGIAKRVKSQESRIKSPQIIVSAVEHESVLETVRDLEKDGVEVIYLPVDRSGAVNLKKLQELLNNQTILISVMYANNEIGSIQPIAEISKIVRNFREAGSQKLGAGSQKPALPIFHSDAAQAFQFLDCNADKLGIDLMTLSAHKIYGPKGTGALYVRQQLATGNLQLAGKPAARSHLPDAIITGGSQEFGLRSGTENVPLIIGFAKAVELALEFRSKESKRISELRDYFRSKIHRICPAAELNGDPELSLPNILNVYFPSHKAEELLAKLDLAGLAASSGSACRSRAIESSYVIEALGFDKKRAKSSIRFSFGRPTAKEELDRALEIIRMSL